MAGGAMAQAGRPMPLTSRSVMIMISPITVTKISFTPSSGSIGEAWVRMCSMPAATACGVVLEPRRAQRHWSPS